MSATSTLESLREVLAGEHSLLESCVRESFSAMETLHGELSDWQRDLTRQQASLDQREAAVNEGLGANESQADSALQQELGRVREEARQLEEENAEQLQAIEDLDRQLALTRAESRMINKRAEELSASIETERERATEERRHYTTEVRELRRLLERQGSLLERLTGAEPEDGVGAHASTQDETDDEATEAGGRAAELLRRASSRRAQQRPN